MMEFQKCGTKQSFFQLISDYSGNTARAEAFHRICTLMRLMGAQSAIVDTELSLEEKKRFSEEVTAVKQRMGRSCQELTCSKFTFIRKDTNNLNDLYNAPDNEFLGYAILATITTKENHYKWSYVFESVIREIQIPENQKQWDLNAKVPANWRTIPHQFLHVQRKFLCEVGTRKYQIGGCYFRQQNSITNVCAHACFCMMLNNISGTTLMVTPEVINKHLGCDHKTPKTSFLLPPSLSEILPNIKAGKKLGLTFNEMAKVFSKFGYKAYQYSFQSEAEKLHFRETIYGFMESRFPAVVAFGAADKPGHVFTVVGHTLSPHSWLPKKYHYDQNTDDDAGRKNEISDNQFSYMSSLAWIDHLVVHDDNFGMQFTFPAHSFNPNGSFNECQPFEALGIFPKSFQVKLHGHEAVQIAANLLRRLAKDDNSELKLFNNGNRYTERLLKKNKLGKLCLRNDVVFRQVLIPWEKFTRRHLKQLSERHERTKHLLKNMHNAGLEYVWLIEVTEADLFVGNQSKIIDIVLNPLAPVIEPINNLTISESHIILVRFPTKTISQRNLEWYELPDWKPEERHIPMFKFESEY